MNRVLLLLLLIIFPAVSFAALFDVASTDKSMVYLGRVFGSVSGLPITSSGNSFFSVLMGLFNQIVFVLGVCVIAYTTVVGAIHTAHEGKFLGESKWHPILVPLRAAVGLYILLPSASGYNWIQVAVLWFIVQGVGAANQLWSQVIISNQEQGGINQNTSQQTMQDAQDTIDNLFQCVLCMVAINQNPTVVSDLESTITAFRFADSLQFGRLSHQGTETPLCGSIDLAAAAAALTQTGDTQATIENREGVIADAIFLAISALQPSAVEALTLPQSQWAYANAFLSAAGVLTNAIQALTFTLHDLSQSNRSAIADGWIFAGAYYFSLVKHSQAASVPLNITVLSPGGPTPDQDTRDAITTALGPTLGGQMLVQMTAPYTSYTTWAGSTVTSAPTAAGGQLNIPNTPDSNNKWIKRIINAVFGGFINIIGGQILQYITKGITEGKNDPLVSMASFGTIVLNLTESIYFGSVAGIFGVYLAVSTGSALQPAPFAFQAMFTFLVPIAFILVGILWSTGVILGLYVPLVPYLVYGFAALGWIILVIEAMLGAPLIALSLIIPSEDEIGKAGHGIIILLSLFLRPILMVLGFILAIRLLTVGISMLNFGFYATLTASTGSAATGIFGMISLIFLYTSICVSIVHEAFSLIYVIPNKILRWMGAPVEGEAETGGIVKDLKGSADHAAEVGGGLMKGSLSQGTESIDNKKKENKKAAGKAQ